MDIQKKQAKKGSLSLAKYDDNLWKYNSDQASFLQKYKYKSVKSWFRQSKIIFYWKSPWLNMNWLTPCPHLGVYCSLSQPGLELVEDDGDGVQLLVSHWGHDQLLGEGGRGHHGVRGELVECRVEQHAVISEMNFKSWLILFICPALSLMSPNGSIQHGSKDYDGGINAVATQSPTSIQKS